MTNLRNHIEVLIFYKSDAMFVILEGEVKMREGQHDFGHLKRGDCFGGYALIDNDTRSASVTAIQDTKEAKIDREHF